MIHTAAHQGFLTVTHVLALIVLVLCVIRLWWQFAIRRTRDRGEVIWSLIVVAAAGSVAIYNLT